jgi:hexosaminidase
VLTQGGCRVADGIRVEFTDGALAPLVERFATEVVRLTGIRVELAAGKDRHGVSVVVECSQDTGCALLPRARGVSPTGAAVDESYLLQVGTEGILVRAAERTGVAHGLTTLLQALALTPAGGNGTLVLPGVRILDAPAFAWRGLTLDVARRYLAPRDVKRLVDLLALYKCNVLHLHLCDDEGWRIAAARPPHCRAPDGTFYSDAELADLVAYAAERFVTIVPEVDSPGHVRALVTMRPELDTGRNTAVSEVPGTPAHAAWLDPDLEASFAIFDGVLAELARIFPGPYLHIGGDEPFGMPEDLYRRFVRHVHARARSLGKRTIGWQETARAIADPDHVVQYWRHMPASENVRRQASPVEGAHPVVLSPVTHTYLDVPYAEPSVDSHQEAICRQVGLKVYRPSTIAETFAWDPATFGRDLGMAISGVGAAIWQETIRSFDELTFLLLPRLAGVAEKAWSEPQSVTWADHRERLGAHGRMWTRAGLSWFASSMVDWR